MGGTVTVAFRRKSGEEYIAHRWTNSLPYWLCNPNFWNEESVDAYIKYGDDGDAQRFKRLTPSEYGVVAIDFPNKKIFSRQHYTQIGSLGSIFLDKESATNLLELAKLGWVQGYEFSPLTGEVNDRLLTADEIPYFLDWVKVIAGGPDEGGSVELKTFHLEDGTRGIVRSRYLPPGWKLDDDCPRGNRCALWWPDAQKFLKENGWGSRAWSLAEVKRRYEQ